MNTHEKIELLQIAKNLINLYDKVDTETFYKLREQIKLIDTLIDTKIN